MLLSSLLLIPIIGVVAILVNKDKELSEKNIKLIALTASILNLFLSLIIFILFDFSTNQFQFVQEYHEISYFDFYLGVDGLSIYFVLLTTIIIPISLLSNWTSISKDVESYVIVILLLETLLLAVFLVLDILLFYIFFESILPPLFILIGIFGSDNRVKASFYLFLYTLLGSLFLLLSILAMSSIMSTTDFDTLFKGNFIYLTQLFLFYGIFIAFAVKTPTIFLNTWLLKAHVESPLGGSIILAAIVLKLSLYGIFRLILPLLPKAYMEYTYIIYFIGVITIVYASLSTLRTIDVKELIAYSSVSHAAVYLLGVFSNSIQGIVGGINLGLAHGLVSPGLFICAGGVLYDRSHSRLISFYKGMAQLLPLFAILFFILCLGNCGSPLTLNFIGEFMALYGVFERSSLFGALASSSIVFSAAYTIYMYQRISFGGSYSRMFTVNIVDLNKREFMVLLTLVVPTVIFGIYTAPILDCINYSVSTLIYSFDFSVISSDAPRAWGLYFQDGASPQMEALVELHDNIVYYLVAILFSVGLIQRAILIIFRGRGFLSLNAKNKLVTALELDLDNLPKPHSFTSLPLQSSIFNFNKSKRYKFYAAFITSIIVAGIAFLGKYIILHYSGMDIFDILANTWPSLGYFCTLGGLRFLIKEWVENNILLTMNEVGSGTGSDSIALKMNTGGSGSGSNAGNGSSSSAGSNVGNGSSSSAGSNAWNWLVPISEASSSPNFYQDHYAELLVTNRDTNDLFCRLIGRLPVNEARAHYFNYTTTADTLLRNNTANRMSDLDRLNLMYQIDQWKIRYVKTHLTNNMNVNELRHADLIEEQVNHAWIDFKAGRR